MNQAELQALAARMGQAINESDVNDEVKSKETGVIIICVDRATGNCGWIASLYKPQVMDTLSAIISKDSN